jgi:hypothetical protein
VAGSIVADVITGTDGCGGSPYLLSSQDAGSSNAAMLIKKIVAVFFIFYSFMRITLFIIHY